jgi:hypothetical protein
MARYLGLLLAPPAIERELMMLFWPIFGNFLCPVVTLVTFGSNLCNFFKDFFAEKNAIFLVFQYSNTRRTRFDQSSPVQPVSEMQKSRKIKKKKNLFFF